MTAAARVLAFYLPQFHPIPENDEWWEPGFTEWTNVARARPLFPGHAQPRLPGELGFYDLRLDETRRAQAELARTYGVEGFCYWHYWFAGRRLLDRPFREVLDSGRPDLPFCLGWANQTWTGVWHGSPEKILVEQTYPGEDDHRRHFETILSAFVDSRYVTVDGRPLFYVHEPHGIPKVEAFIDLWRRLAAEAGLPGMYLVADAPVGWDASAHGFDAYVQLPWADFIAARPARWKLEERLFRRPKRVPYAVMAHSLLGGDAPFAPLRLPCVIPNWDNTPRSGRRGLVVPDSSPARFRVAMAKAVAAVAARPAQERIVFVKSWNEWAEGNYLEPDRESGRQYLEAIAAAVGGRPAKQYEATGGG